MIQNLLEGKKVAVLVETEYIPAEIQYYQDEFARYGAEVDLLTNLWGASERVLVSDVTEPGKMPETIRVTKDVADACTEDYAIVLCAANYVACRLREIPPMGSLGSAQDVSTPPAVAFMADAMRNPNIVKGMLCHALWLLTPVPELLRDRRVICHTVVLADVLNAGGSFVPDESHIVVDGDLVTGRSMADVKPYVEALLNVYMKCSS